VAISFKPLKLGDPGLFGVGVEGSVGRSDRSLLQELAAKCLARDKTRLILDFSELDTIGGAGAATLADFQRSLVNQGGEAVFVGVADLVHKFLDQKFDDLPLRCYPRVEDAVADFPARVPTSPGRIEPRDRDRPDDAAPSAGSNDCVDGRDGCDSDATSYDHSGSDQDLDSLLGDFSGGTDLAADPDSAGDESTGAHDTDADTSVDDAREPAPAGQKPADAQRTPTHQSGGTAHQFLSLDEAVAALRAATDGTSLRDSLVRLLRGYGLADEVTYFVYQDGRYVSSEGNWSIAADGPLAYELAGADRPLSLLDISQDLSEDETATLAELQPDLMLPVVWDQTLQAVTFLKRAADQEREYEVSEHFALELVMRLLADHGGRGRQISSDELVLDQRPVSGDELAAETEPTADVGANDDGASDGRTQDDQVTAEAVDRSDETVPREPAVLPALFDLARDLPTANEPERFWKLFVERVSGLFLVHSLIHVDLERGDEPSACLGRARSGQNKLDLTGERLAKYFRNLQRPVQVENMPASFKQVRGDLKELGINWIANLANDQQSLGVVLLGLEPRIERDDQTDLIEEILAVTNAALALLVERQHGADLRCDLVRTVIGLYEHHDQSAVEHTELVARLLRALACEVDFPPEQQRELMCGVLLCDIGRIERDGSIAADADDLDEAGQQHYQRHPEIGAALLEQLQIAPAVVEVVLCHHERFDGTGFPRQLQGRKIPLAARLVAVVDNYAALIAGDGKTAGMEPEAAAQALRGDDPGRLDPEIVEAFLKTLAEVDVPVGAH
jgi:HD-GYP domain-containing protein (c-di-GMP phosphodiesterase class II)